MHILKNIFLFFLLQFINYSVFSQPQDTTKILFIGNSFIFMNNLPQLFTGLTQNANITTFIGQHTPGGASVGDTAQGTSAHSNNPVVFNLIKSKKWDYVIVQDNQGRFALNYGVFSSSSNVIGGHLKIQDSVLANNPCANMIWFAGWGFQGPYPPYSNSGTEMIEKIFANYTYLNDTSYQIIAPIGPAWITAINNYSNVNLWAQDSAHPSLAGSYLTACVLYATIFKKDPTNLTYTGGLNPIDAHYYRSIAYSKVLDSLHICNIDSYTPTFTFSNDTLYSGSGYSSYKWFNGNNLIQTTSVNYFKINTQGTFHVVVVDSNGCERKSFELLCIPTSANSLITDNFETCIYPNPSKGIVNIKFKQSFKDMNIRILNIDGQILFSEIINDIYEGNIREINLNNLPEGIYILQLQNARYNKIHKIVLQK